MKALVVEGKDKINISSKLRIIFTLYDPFYGLLQT